MKVLLIDDHPLILQALQSVIQTLGSDTTVVSLPMLWMTVCNACRISG